MTTLDDLRAWIVKMSEAKVTRVTLSKQQSQILHDADSKERARQGIYQVAPDCYLFRSVKINTK